MQQPMPTLATAGTSVYRYYDQHDVLIYAGTTSRGIARNTEHDKSKPWWPHVVRQEVDHLPDRDAALACERELIERHTPPFNVQHNRFHREMLAAYQAMLADIAVNPDPTEALRAAGGKLVLHVTSDTVTDADRLVVFRTAPRHALIAARMQPSASIPKIGDACGVRFGHIKDQVRQGPFFLVTARVRHGVEIVAPVADVRQLPVKGSRTFHLHKITTASRV